MATMLDEEDELLGRPTKTSIPYWRDNYRAWQKKTIAGINVPGNCKLGPIGPELNVQEGPASGKDGGKILLRGLKFKTCTLTTEIDTRADWSIFVNQLAPKIIPVAQPQARDIVDIYHPLLALWKYTKGLVKQVDCEEPRNGGPLIVKILLLLVVERENATHAPVASSMGNVKRVESIPIAGDANRIKDVRDRSRPAQP